MADPINPGILGVAGRAALAGATAGQIAPGTGTAVASTAAGIEGLTNVIDNLKRAVDTVTKSFDTFDKNAQSLAGVMGSGGGWFKSFSDAAGQIDSVRAELQRATGQSDQYTSSVLSLQGALVGLGVNTDEVKSSFIELNEGFSDFSLLGPKVQKTLAKQALQMEKLGISSGDTAKQFQLLGKALNMSQADMIKTQNRITKAALSAGIAPKRMIQDYNSVMPNLIRYGKGAENIFLRLAAQSKATGIEMSRLVGITESYDEFESAADKVGKLNMLLGGPYLNSIQMLKADEEERLELLRNSIKLSGKSIDQFSRFRQKDLMKEFGFTDMKEMYEFFGASQEAVDGLVEKMSPQQRAQINLNKAIEKGVTIAERFQAFFESASRIIGSKFLPIMQEFASFMMSGSGGKAITTVLSSFASGIESVTNLYKGFSPELKDQIKSFGIFALKMTATSFAVSGLKKAMMPLLELFTSPATGLVAVTTWLLTNWDENTGVPGLVNSLANQFVKLDKSISNFLDKYSKEGPLKDWIKPVKELWTTIRGLFGGPSSPFNNSKKITDGLLETWKNFIGEIQKGFTNIGGFFEKYNKEGGESKSLFGAIGKAIKKEVDGIIDSILTSFETKLLDRYGGVLGDLLDQKRDDALGGAGKFFSNRTLEVGSKLVGSGDFDRFFAGKLTAAAGKLGGVEEVSRFLSELKEGSSYDDLAMTKVGRAFIDMGVSDLRNKSAMIEAISQTRHSGGNVQAMTPTRFRQDEGLIYAPSGNAFVMAASLMNNNGMNPGSNNDKGNIYLDGEKVGRVLFGNNYDISG
tara:strand:+ start:4227 stop:6641 length:2415 start_codon:yes stop_codon:yes gene_type:complete